MPISYLENVLHNTTSKPEIQAYNIEGETVTIKELIDFWIEGHKAAEEVSKIVEENLGGEKECNMIGTNTLTQNQSTGKKPRKSTKKTTITQK